MVNHKHIAVVLVIGLVAVLMTSASTRAFAQPSGNEWGIVHVHGTIFIDEQGQVHTQLAGAKTHVGNALAAQRIAIMEGNGHVQLGKELEGPPGHP